MTDVIVTKIASYVRVRILMNRHNNVVGFTAGKASHNANNARALVGVSLRTRWDATLVQIIVPSSGNNKFC